MNIPLKTKVKYWFYFLRLCHQSNDPVVQSNLKKSKTFYEPWDNYLTGSYECPTSACVRQIGVLD